MIERALKIILGLMFAVAVIAGIYFGVVTKSFQGFLLVAAAIILLGSLFLIVPLVYIRALRDEHNTVDRLLTTFISQVRSHPTIAIWPTGGAALVFFSLATMWGIVIYGSSPEEAVALIKNSFIYEVVSFIIMVFGVFTIFAARISSRFSFHSILSKHITPEFIAEKPQAAIEHSFTILEDHLRTRLKADPTMTGELLTNAAFGYPNGQLVYGVTEAESKGIRNLFSGAFAAFRNPRKHRIVQDDEHSTIGIIALIDLLIQIVDKSPDRKSGP